MPPTSNPPLAQFIIYRSTRATAAAATTTTSQNVTRAVPSRSLRGLQAGDPCFMLPVDWSSERGQILLNGYPFHIKVRFVLGADRGGLDQKVVGSHHRSKHARIHPNPPGTNYFGFETNTFFPHGLWGDTTMDRVFTFMRENGFNALRAPFSAELALDPGRVVRVADPALDNLGNIDRIARFVDVAAEYNILVRGGSWS